MLRTMSLTSSRFRSLGVAVGLLGLLLSVPACVPYVKYEDAIAKLNRANQVNGDLERAMRDAQLGETQAGGDLRAAIARIESLQARNSAVQEQNDLLSQKVAELEAARDLIPEVTISNPSIEGIDINPDTQGLMLSNDLLFSAGKATLRNQAKGILDQLASVILRDHPGKFVFIDGHTDDTPITRSAKVNKDNWDLGSKRAHAVFDYFKSKGIPEKSMVITSHGFAQPVSGVDLETPAGKAKCRRVEIRIKERAY